MAVQPNSTDISEHGTAYKITRNCANKSFDIKGGTASIYIPYEDEIEIFKEYYPNPTKRSISYENGNNEIYCTIR